METKIQEALETAHLLGGKILNLQGLGLNKLPEAAFELTNLEVLVLFQNNLQAMPEGLEHFPKLKSLYLRANEISRVDAIPPQLELLDLSANKIASLDAVSWSDHLQLLILQDNQIAHLPVGFFSQSNLELISLRGNRLLRLDYPFADLPRLANLILGQNPATELPPALWQLTGLRQLEIDGLGVQSLPPEISNLKQLEILDLSENPLSNWPEALVHLPRLRSLTLRNMAWQALPPRLARMQHLDYLDLSQNRLSVFPAELAALKGLDFLDVTDCELDIDALRQILPEEIQLVTGSPSDHPFLSLEP